MLADEHKNAVYLGERDCSMQRRHQKIIEEAPAPRHPSHGASAIGERCAEACRKIGYRGAGTFEFLYEDGEFYLHRDEHARAGRAPGDRDDHAASTSCRTQIRVAAGEKLPFTQRDIMLRGHAIECRINAEDPYHVHAVARAASRRGTRRAARASASIRTSTATTSCRRTTTR